MERMYRIGEFAALTGISIRTLHHYDQIDLLRPSAHSESGYRLYSDRDLLQIQQILTLRYLGFPLAQIRELLRRLDFDLMASMRIQRGALRDRISELERIEAALEELLRRRVETGRWAWDLVARTSATVQHSLNQTGDKMNEYYSPEEMKKRFEEIGKTIPPETIQDVERRWTALLREIRASRNLDPASEQARALADRWNALLEETVGPYRDDGKLMGSIAEGYREGRYAHIEGAPTAEDFAFIARVNEARRS